jgi:hypothetical protein
VIESVNPSMAAVGPVGQLEKQGVFAHRFGGSVRGDTAVPSRVPEAVLAKAE